MTGLWRYCAHCDLWHRTQGHGVACTNHGDVIEFVSNAVLVLPPGVKACPSCLELDEAEAEAPPRSSTWAELKALVVSFVDHAIETVRQDELDQQAASDMISEGAPIWASPP